MWRTSTRMSKRRTVPVARAAHRAKIGCQSQGGTSRRVTTATPISTERQSALPPQFTPLGVEPPGNDKNDWVALSDGGQRSRSSCREAVANIGCDAGIKLENFGDTTCKYHIADWCRSDNRHGAQAALCLCARVRRKSTRDETVKQGSDTCETCTR